MAPAPFAKVGGAWSWFVEGLVEVILWVAARTRGTGPYRLRVEDDGAVLFDPDGKRLGCLTGGDAPPRFEPPDLARTLGGRALDIVVPSAWRFRRDLDPVAVQSRPFLDAFVRHQIERITPWRPDAVHYRILQSPLPGDANRLAVSLVIVPRRLTERWLAPLESLGLSALRLTASEGPDEAIALGAAEPQGVKALRRGIAWSLAGLTLATLLLSGWLEWEAGLVRADIDDQDRVLAERKAVLVRARMHDGAGDATADAIRKLRNGRPLAVAVIDALAAAVPDTAYLTSLSIEKDHVAISGLSRAPSELVPALETSGRFADVAFAAPTTRTESGGLDRFGLTMRVLATDKPPPDKPTLAAVP